MWAHERHARIVALLNERQRLTTENFSAELGVSKERVRQLEHRALQKLRQSISRHVERAQDLLIEA